MAQFKEYSNYDALALAELVKTKQVTPLELLEAAIEKADQLNPRLNAIIHRFDEDARKAINSGMPNGPFSGVPFLIKDLGAVLKGQPMTYGSRGIGIIPDHDNDYMKRLKATGLVGFGKTNTPEFGFNITTEPKAHGATHNPHKQGYSSGGSSGGSAAAIKAGIVPIASAGDGGGSIRFPASWCGLFGLKPSRGRVSVGPEAGENWSGAVADHVLTRTVRDSAAMLDELQGYEAGGPYKVSYIGESFLSASKKDPKPLKIALAKKTWIDADVDPEVMDALYKTAKTLESLGHTVEEVEPDIDASRYWRDFYTVVSVNLAYYHKVFKRKLGKAAVKQFEPTVKSSINIGYAISAEEFMEAKQGWHSASLAMGRLLSDFDMMLCPTVPTPAVPHGELVSTAFEETLLKFDDLFSTKLSTRLIYNSALGEKMITKVLSKMTYTILGNMTGLPAMSLPLHSSSQGLPIGMQFYGRMCDEASLFSLAGQFEREGLFV